MAGENRFINEEFNTFGPCLFFMEDVDKTVTRGESVWVGFGRSGPFSFDPEITTVQRSQWVRSEMIESGDRITGRKATCSIPFHEINYPNTMQLLWGDKTSSLTKTNPRIRHADFEDTLYRLKSTGKGISRALPHASGFRTFGGGDQLPAFASLVGVPTAAGTGSGWSTAGNPDYYAFARGIFRKPGSSVVPTAATVDDADKNDIEWELGAANTAGVGVDFANATDIVTFAGTAHGKDAALPDYVAIYMKATDTIVGATCVAVAACTAGAFSSAAVLTLGAASTYVAGNGLVFYAVTGTHDVPVYTLMTIGTDIMWDSALAEYYLPDDTTDPVTTGVPIAVRYFYSEPYSESIPIGPTGLAADYRKVMVICLEPQEQGGNPVHMAGEELILYKVNTAGLQAAIKMGSDGFYEGDPITFRCLADPSNGNYFGTRRSLSNSHRDYIQQFE